MTEHEQFESWFEMWVDPKGFVSMSLKKPEAWTAWQLTRTARYAPTQHTAYAAYEDHYAEAFYEIARALGIAARPVSPKAVFENEMLPMIKRLVASTTGASAPRAPSSLGLTNPERIELDSLRETVKRFGGRERCQYCDGTGDVHSIDGEWRGECAACKAGDTQDAARYRALSQSAVIVDGSTAGMPVITFSEGHTNSELTAAVRIVADKLIAAIAPRNET